ncbi:hypothetical protein J5N97_004889 [Dioscorea zingiberensis]|uniref:CTLH domain-containing protein n=1 Tax=Dioscorea zingiberensis TaxID=325984 RepID=A0A9D5D7H1_9LILI|nr:hypothetical protein J5N97_004889 [Dioscorea zingiberensis]
MTNDDPKHCVKVHFILQYLKSAGLDDTAHTLERESGLFFNVDRLEAFLMAGDWDVAERYISGFTSINDSRASMQLFFEIRKQKYLEALDDDSDHHRAFSILQTELQPFSAYAPVLFSELTLLLTKKNFRENKELAKYGNAEMSRKMLVGVIRKLVHANPKLRDLVKTPNPHLSTLLSLLRARQEMATNQQRVNHPRPPNGVQKPCAIPQKRPSLVSDSRAAKRPRDILPPGSNVQKLCAIRPTIPTPVSVSKMVPHQLSTSTPLASAVENLCPIREMIPSSQQRACSKGVCANGQPEIPPSAAITDEASGSSGISRISADQLPQTTATRSPTDLQAHYFNSSPNTCKADSNVAAFTKEKAACRENNQAAEPHTMNTVVKFSDPSPLPNPPASEKHVGSNWLSHPPVAPNPAPVAAQTTNPPPMCCSVVSSVDSPIAQAAAPNLKSCSESWKIVARNPIPSTLGPSLGVPKGCYIVAIPRPPNGVQKPCAIPQKRPSLVSDSKRAAKQPRDNPPPWSNVQKLCAIQPTIPTPVSVSKMEVHQLSTNTQLTSAVQKLCPIRETFPSSQRACSKGVCANGQPEIPPSAAITDKASGSSGISRISADQLPQTTATRSPTDLQAHYFNSSPNTCKADSNVAAFTMEKAACRENNQAAEPHTMNTVVKFSDPSPLPKTPASEKHVESNGLSHPPVAPNPAPAAAQTTNPPPMCCSVVSSVDSPIAQAAAPNLKSCSENWKIVARNPIPSTLGPSLGVSKGCEGDPRPSQRPEASHLRSHVAAKGDNSDLADKEDSFCWPTEAILVKGTSTPEKSEIKLIKWENMNWDTYHMQNTSSAVKSDYINSRSEAAEGKEKCKLLAIDEPSECHSLRLLDSSPVKVLRLMYSHSGDALWALAFNGVNKLWQWKKIDKNSTGKADVRQQPELKTPVNDKVLANELSATATNNALHWFALSRNDGYLMSLSGGPISLYNTKLRKVRFNLTGHNRRITSLALSPTLNLLVSSGEDAQICTWNLSEIEEPQENRILKRMPRGRVSTLVMKKVQFHPDGMHFLAVCKRQLLTFKASELKLLHRMKSPRAITDATYSCDGQSIYCSFEDGSVVVLSTLLDCKCWISQKTYLHQPISLSVIPHAIAAHPKIPNQFCSGIKRWWSPCS